MAMTILMIVLGSVTQIFQSASDAADAHDVRIQTVESLNRGLGKILKDLKFSGHIGHSATDFPIIFEDGNAGSGFAVHNHAAPHRSGGGTVVAREVIFLHLLDSDGDGMPEVDASSEASWDPAQLSYVLIPQADGTNRIERRINGVFDEVILKSVDSMIIDNRTTSGFAVPFGSLRVTITSSKNDRKGRRFSETVSGTVALRNSSGI